MNVVSSITIASSTVDESAMNSRTVDETSGISTAEVAKGSFKIACIYFSALEASASLPSSDNEFYHD